MNQTTQFYYQQADRIIGPLNGIQLREEAFSGQIAPDTRIRLGQDGSWLPANRLNNLFDVDGRVLPHPPETQEVLQARSSTHVWWVYDHENVLGPYSDAALKERAARGKITPETMISRGNSGRWVEADLLAGVFPGEPEPQETHEPAGAAPVESISRPAPVRHPRPGRLANVSKLLACALPLVCLVAVLTVCLVDRRNGTLVLLVVQLVTAAILLPVVLLAIAHILRRLDEIASKMGDD